MSRIEIITDSNWRTHVADARRAGFGRGWIERPASEGAFGSAYSGPLIDRAEWPERIRDLVAKQARISDVMKRGGVRTKNQRSIPYCWIFAAISAVEAKRAVAGMPYVSLSPASAGAPLTGYRSVGGWSSRGLRYVAEHGVAPTELWPDIAINRQYDNEQSRAERVKYKVSEWWELRPRNIDQLASCLLSGIPVACGYNWWGHAILVCDLIQRGRDAYDTLILNSWGEGWGEGGWGVLSGSRAIADDAIAPRSITAA